MYAIIGLITSLWSLLTSTLTLGVYGALYGLVVAWEQVKRAVAAVSAKLKEKSKRSVDWISADD